MANAEALPICRKVFLANVNKPMSALKAPGDDCWIWQGEVTYRGYPAIGIRKAMAKELRAAGHKVKAGRAYAHRLAAVFCDPSFPLIGGDDKRQACHTCDTPACVNPAHIQVGTPTENYADALYKGRRVALKLGFDEVGEIRALYKAGKLSQRAIGARFNVSQSAVSRIVNRQTWMLDRPS